MELSEADLSSSFSPLAHFVFTSPCSTLLVLHRSTQRRLNPLQSSIIIKYPNKGLLRVGLQDARNTYLFDFISINDNDDGRDTESAFLGCVYVMFSYDIIIYYLSIYRLHEMGVRWFSCSSGSVWVCGSVRLISSTFDREQSDTGCISDRLCSLFFLQSRTAEQRFLAIPIMLQTLQMHEIMISCTELHNLA